MFAANPFNAAYDVERATRGWWVLLVTGLISVIAGGIILFTDWKLNDLAIFIGALLVFRGIFSTLNVPIDGSGRGWAVALGLLEVALGVMVWAWPSPTLLVIAFWIGWYVLFSGIMAISTAIAGRDVLPFWGFMVAFGVIDVLLAFWLLGQPGITLVAAVLALGLWSLLYGVMLIVGAFDLKRVGDKAARVDSGLREMSSPQAVRPAAS
jgi:uncharacterized membrane protein HdeD (DUF308 family)